MATIATDTHVSFVTVALAYAARGWLVFPCHTIAHGQCTCSYGATCSSPGKHPRTPHGLRDATTDTALIRRYWLRWPTANIGIATGKESNLVVLDTDPRHGGEEELDTLEKTNELLPHTAETVTGSGGRHLLFTYPDQGTIPSSAGTLAPGVDVRGDGGYIIAPPSRHLSGRAYAWELEHHPEEVPLAPLPSWLIARLQTSKIGQPLTIPEVISEGGRNDLLFRLGCSLRAKGLSESAILAALAEENKTRCSPPLPAKEVEVIARQAGKYPPGTVSADGHETAPMPPFSVDQKASPNSELLLGMLDIDERFKRTWEHKRKDIKNQAIEVYEYSLARQVQMVEWEAQEIVNLLIFHRRKFEAPAKDEAYYRKILQKTSIVSDKSDEDGIAEIIIEDTLAQGEDAAIAFLQEKLGIPIIAVIQRGEENARYSFRLDGGREIEIGSANVLVNNQREVRAKLFEVSGLVMKIMKDDQWVRISNVFRVIMVTIPLGNSSRVDQIREWIRSYLESTQVSEFPSALADNAPVIEEGIVYIHQGNLRRYLITHWMERMTSQDMRSWLSEAGFTVATKTGRVSGKVLARSYWHAPEAVLLEPHSPIAGDP